MDLSTLSNDELIGLYNSQRAAPVGASDDQQQQAMPAASDGALRITVRPKGAMPDRPLTEWSDDELKAAYSASKGPGYGEDMLKSAGAGLVRGVSGLVGAPADLVSLLEWGIQKGERAITGEDPDNYRQRVEQRKASAPLAVLNPAMDSFQQNASGKAITGAVERNVTGPLHEPKTTAGEFVRTATEFVPAAMLGPGGMVRNAITYGVGPGLLSEAGGQVTKGSAAEPWVRGGLAVAGGFAGAALSRPNNAGRMVREATEGLTPAQLDAAENLFQAAQLERMPITRAEAVQHVTNGASGLGDLQRVVEGSGALKQFFAQRPAQVEAAGRQMFDTITRPTADPSSIGREASRAAQTGVREVEGAINASTRPLYQAAEAQRIDAQTFARVSQDPVFRRGLERVRNDEWIGPQLAQFPDDSVAVVDAVKKVLDETGRNLRAPSSGTARNNFAASIVDSGRDRAVAAADRATGSTATQMGTYEAARDAQEWARRTFLQPLLDGPIGKLNKKELSTRKAIDALFPRNPLPNSQDEIREAVTMLAQRRPEVTRQLVRAHIESTFNQATRTLQPGANQWGGAGFAAALRGNPQQAANLEASIRALPNGDAVWPGANRFLEILEAQGTRQRAGSQTSFNNEIQGELRRGSTVGDAMTLVAGAGVKWPSKIKDSVERWRLGKGVDQIARLFTDPQAAGAFRQLAESPVGSSKATALAIRLGFLGARAPAAGTSGSNDR